MSRNLPVVVEKQHADLGASSAYRWMACAGSINLIARLDVKGEESIYAREGTAAHTLGERALSKKRATDFWVGERINGIEVTDDMAGFVDMFVQHCLELVALAKFYWIERKFDLADLKPPGRMFGTADFACYIAEDFTLHVVDLKYGQGVVVEVFDNPQTMYYALGAALSLLAEYPDLRIDQIVMTIVQPRIGHIDGSVRSQTVPFGDLLSWSNTLIAKAEATIDPNAPLTVGDHCRFCPAAPHCPAYAAEALAVAQSEFSTDINVPPPPEMLPANVLGEMLQKLPILEAWGRAMWGEAQRRLEAGEKVPGLKLVERRPRRKWLDENKTIEYMDTLGVEEDAMYERTLKSPAQMEKVLGKKSFKAIEPELVEKVSSGNTVALDADIRPAVQAVPGQELLVKGTPPNESISFTEEI